ncbi:type I glyceraldehyde-3-phosphate dehydrogenase [Dactylosporangium matsuzakiense]|uniref:Glyceraldehyde-3-phosphate dehydrogenase n=1 Tax=Dactylosporangium matsuzakiense TaxID=53360 RepID=A0A9W6KUV4_9ACTN|nr:type I glyceraldehyde-3-phosphate dehydrogenase [Dactylosporangium matsuzakiense]UWZ48321.1 type I glyceraldehyde-3-phosphate dehydrogenase [Dactylosporangium matsuzakiense]GLL07642.1 glyceraldehyde-3-phosphate dehydrogenase [Dactylosporangium matsuzakiense]
MTYRIAINGFGRIGRDVVRCLVERSLLGDPITVVAINDLFDAASLAHLLQYDSTFGRLRSTVDVDPSGGGFSVGGQYIEVIRQRDPAFLPWADLDVDLVIESTGRFRARDDAAVHLKAGARKVLISAPGRDADATIVLGVNDATYDPQRHDIVSAASCTTNCAAPMAQVLHNAFGIEQGMLTTVHAYTNDQVVLDAPHKDPRRGRTAATNIIPTGTGAAKAIGLVLPELAGRLGGIALRVPVENGSMTDLTVRLAQPATTDQVNAAFAAAAAGPLAGVLRYSDAPLVSRDIIGDPASCVFDSGLTAADGQLVKVFGWYDNEWGYTNRLVDLALLVSGAEH